MPIECYRSDCSYHASQCRDMEGPFCSEQECLRIPEVAEIVNDEVFHQRLQASAPDLFRAMQHIYNRLHDNDVLTPLDMYWVGKLLRQVTGESTYEGIRLAGHPKLETHNG